MRCLIVLCLLAISYTAVVDYSNQGTWGDDCGGTSQSPIDLMPSTPYTFNTEMMLDFDSSGSITNTPQLSSQVYLEPDDEDYGITKMTNEDGETTDWEIIQYHWHYPSEHTVDGYQSDAELHIVH